MSLSKFTCIFTGSWILSIIKFIAWAFAAATDSLIAIHSFSMNFAAVEGL